ncbi:hypothetical protein [Reichenbachiella sp.]|uniref:hypothetical protein n=1 Tax=Reichenbachiella sp. TaxID=2184521 RepID=UPI003BAF9477
MKTQNSRLVLIRVVFIVLFIGATFSFLREISDEEFSSNAYSSEYKKINKEDMITPNLVDSVFSHMGFILISLANNQKICLPYTRNFQFKAEFLGDFLNVGDVISKKRNSDTLFIIRNDERFVFVVGKTINKEE